MTLARAIAAALDPVILASQIGWTPDPWQAEVLRADDPRILINASRQSGKSTMAALKAVHVAVHDPGALILMLSPSARQSGELFKRSLGFYKALGRPVAAEAESAATLTLENGSRIVSLPGSEGTIRGYSGVKLLLVDEAARVPDELYAAVRPMLAVSAGRLIAMSTPWGLRGWWATAWHDEPHWSRVRITADQVTRISPEFLEEERRALGSYLFDQEYMGRFADSVETVFTTEMIRAATSADVHPLFGGADA